MLCFRLHFAKDATIGNTAGATVRQLVSLVFERVVIEDASSEENSPVVIEAKPETEFLKEPADSSYKNLKPFAQDGFSLFQVIFIDNIREKCLLIFVLGSCVISEWRSAYLARWVN